MKKVLFVFAIAVAASLALVSCNDGGKDASKTSGEEVSTEQTSQSEEASEEVKIEALKELTCDNYTLNIPDDWKASSSMVRSSCNLTLREDPYSTAMLNYGLESEKDIVDNLVKRECKPAEDIKVGDKTYKVYVKDGDSPELNAYVPKGEGFVTFRIMPGGTTKKGDELKEVLMKNLNDIINATTLK